MEPSRACRLEIGGGAFPGPVAEDTIDIAPADHYALQGEAFSDCVLQGRAAPWPIEDAVANMRALDALFASARSGGWQTVAAAA